MRHVQKVGVYGLPFLALSLFLHGWLSYTAEHRLAALLEVPVLPASVRVLDCQSEGWEDDYTWCVGVAALEDIHALMSGFAFEPDTSWSDLPRNVRTCEIPEKAVPQATSCYRHGAPEIGDGAYIEFGFNETKGEFFAARYTP